MEKKEITIKKEKLSKIIKICVKSLGIPFVLLLILVHFGEVYKTHYYVNDGNAILRIPVVTEEYYTNIRHYDYSNTDDIPYFILLTKAYIPAIFTSLLIYFLLMAVIILIILILKNKYKIKLQ
ncbi:MULTISPECIES: hypothetical protein [Myroides]|uniref:hypothetical protein n=1 Tax=Myroides TaxID=76831 RepID=UPI000741CD5A|nr:MULTISPECIES: hypothetical protein [Myroides]KUF45782.1 hypothetical protein AS361_01585 [Myroides marinus]MDM1499494.1 hypothetical protein [Myroides odoratimimus]